MVTVARPPCDEGVIRSEPCAQAAQPARQPWILAATILGSSMAFIDGTVVNVALPALQQDLHATASDLLWVVEAYALFLSALILVGGALGDHLGRRRVFGAGVALFTLASIWCGLAPSVAQLVVARAVQGVGGALLVPGSLALISASFDQDHRGQAIGTWSGFTTITSAAGPVFGGWLVQHASWRWVFFLNVPLAVLTLLLLLRVPESRDEVARGGLDWWGAGLVTLGLGAVVYGFIEAGTLGLGQPMVLASLAIGVVALGIFVAVEARSPAPMVPLGLFRSRTFSGTNLLTLLLYGALGGALYFLPFNLQQVQGYSPTAAGAALLPFTAVMFLLSRWAGGLIPRYGATLPLTVGPVIAAAGFFLFTLPGIGGSYWTTYFPAVLVLAVGMAITVAPLTTAVMGSVPSNRAGVASGINNAVARTAGLLAIAVLGVVVVAAFDGGLNSRLDALQPPAAVRQDLEQQRTRLAGAQIPPGVHGAERVALRRAIDEAFVDGFRAAMFIGAGLALASAVSAAVLVEGRPKRGADPAGIPQRKESVTSVK
jgi:EmrB/QacA subfamily drug resistance transporter